MKPGARRDAGGRFQRRVARAMRADDAAAPRCAPRIQARPAAYNDFACGATDSRDWTSARERGGPASSPGRMRRL